MIPYLETAFRRPLLLLVPAVLITTLVFFGMVAKPKTYTASVTLWVESSEAYTSAARGTASEREARAFTERLSTLAFRKQVITIAGLEPLVERFEWPQPSALAKLLAKWSVTKRLTNFAGGTPPTTRDEAWAFATRTLAKNLKITSHGTNLTTVSFSGTDREISQSLVRAATTVYLAEKANAALLKMNEGQRLQRAVLADLEKEVAAARSAYLEFGAALPVTRSAAQERQLADRRLVYEQALQHSQDAKLRQADSTFAAVADQASRESFVSLVDLPELPSAPSQGIRQILFMTAVGAFLGLALGAALVVLSTWSDRGLHTAEDIDRRLRVEVIGVVPLIKAGAGRSGI